VIKVKMIISYVAITMLALSFGAAFADEWPTDKSHLFLGTELRNEVLPVQKAEIADSAAKGEAAGGLRAEGIDKSTMIEKRSVGRDKVYDLPDPYGDFYDHEISAGVTDAAPGGIREEKSKEGKVRDNVYDLPDPYGDYIVPPIIY
jgi:hypothetical protein